MTINFQNSVTEARVLKVLSKLPYTQTKEQFFNDALTHYIDFLINEKKVKL